MSAHQSWCRSARTGLTVLRPAQTTTCTTSGGRSDRVNGRLAGSLCPQAFPVSARFYLAVATEIHPRLFRMPNPIGLLDTTRPGMLRILFELRRDKYVSPQIRVDDLNHLFSAIRLSMAQAMQRTFDTGRIARIKR